MPLSTGVVVALDMAPARIADTVRVSGGVSGCPHPSAPDETCTGFWGRCGPVPQKPVVHTLCPLSLDPAWTPGRVDQQVLQELAAA
jgi:hypothetical protein